MSFKITDIDIVIYHGNCSDGFGSAWAVYKNFSEESDIEYIEGHHATKESDITFWLDKVRGKDVVCYDFSFSRELTKSIHAIAKSFFVIDHHRSAQELLGDLPYCHFDMSKSGAVLAWESVSDEEVPVILKYVQDRDLWKWLLPDSRKLWAYLSSFSKTFVVWDALHTVMENEGARKLSAVKGEAMLNKVANISLAIANGYEMWSIAGYNVPVCNCTSSLSSDVCESLEKLGEFPFVACYQIANNTATWSLRSNQSTEDVSKIASSFASGGGHQKAAGFTVPLTAINFKDRKVTP